MPTKKKHSRAEVASKLAQADDLAEQGKPQSEIARTLGVSVMTLHRWRKAPSDPPTGYQTNGPNIRNNGSKRIADLQFENAQLRRLVTDLLLEKMRLEQALLKSAPKRTGRSIP